MKQAIMMSPGKVEIRQVEIPPVKENEVLVEVKRIGVCGSDLHVYHGKHPFTGYPVVQGHEICGLIKKTGQKVDHLSPGQKVILRPQTVCGQCRPCRDGNYHICETLKVMGFQATGAASEFFAADAGNFIPIPPEMSYDAGAIVEPLAVGVHGARKEGTLEGKKILILGAGTIGNLAAQAVKAMGAAAVMITDISPLRLSLAESCGIDFPVDTRTENLEERLLRHFGEDRADLILDCVGLPATIRRAVEIARKGTAIVIVGVPEQDVPLNFSLVQDRELRLLGTLMYKEEDLVEAIGLIRKGKIDYQRIITNHFPFDEYQKAYEFIDDKKEKVMKVLIDF